ncbi:MAG TPA: ATP-binding protein [Candidatus Kapabacteria bacterium]|nr:ATP-binding protein [Candidatus Kapabacteria bacterium]HOM04546.1 ATP-binding protein [Candidatus Kapabacteria bacterium]
MVDNFTNLFDKYKDFATKLVVCNDLRTLFATVDKLVNEICDYEYMVLYYYTAHSDRLIAVTTKGLTKEERFVAQKTAMQRAPGRCLRAKEIIYIKEADAEAYELQTKFVKPTLLNSRLYIPLINNNQVLGVYSLASTKVDNFSDEVVSAISFITNIAAVIYKKIIDTRDLERMNKRLEEINRNFLSQKLQSIGQLAAGIAHEINTPLQYINDNLDFLEHSYEALSYFASSINELIFELDIENWEKARNIIKKNIKETDIDFFLSEIPGAISQSQEGILKISKIINTIKNFSQVGIREQSFLNINRTLEDIVLITRNEWKKVADVKLLLHDDLPVIYCYADEVNQVLLQFLLNSIDAVKEKMQIDNNYTFGKIEISTCFGERYIAIQFVDDGIGIQEKHLDRIFDPFFTTKPPGKGTGQGLAIAHSVICSKLGGDIFVSSNYLKGTEFIIKLPYE